MTTLQQSIEIPASPLALYDYVTRPVRWKEWHHSSLGVSDVADESLVAGRRFEEDVVVAGGRQRHLTWLVEESRIGQRWRASAYMPDGSTVRLCYEFLASGEGTRFTRHLEYVVGPTLLRWLDGLYLHRKVAAESSAALQRLQDHFARTAL